MVDFIINFFVVVLVLVSLFSILIVLMQRTSAQAGMGAAIGGGPAEQAFGAETGNVLTRATQMTTIVFFVLSFGLYLAFQAKYHNNVAQEADTLLPDAISMEEGAAGGDTAGGDTAGGDAAPAAEDPTGEADAAEGNPADADADAGDTDTGEPTP